ncbi:unnamed protein product [Rhizophagus irregularis]|nr:unnamed protein product [Rhizophagus irregularis]CAB4413098.1 unnamed protein product [Rhizophagus irregularis]
MSIVYDAIAALYLTPDEKSDLRAYFVNNSDKRKELELFISGISNDEVVSCLRKVLRPEFATVGPVAASSQMTEDLVLNKFIQDLKDTEFDAKTSELLKLAYDANFFGLDNQPSRLFIRNCYKDLLDIVLKPEIRNLRISGNPGVGKTFFGYYLLYDLLTKNKTIVYELHTMKGSVILFKEGKGFYLSEGEDHKIIRNYLYKKDTWYIVDGKKPYNASVAKTILISSPMKSHYHDFDKSEGDSVTILIMPVWTWKEINYCRQNLFENLDEKLVSELYVKWGGIPRNILKEALNSSIQRKLTQAVDTCDEKIFQYIGGSNSREDVSHILVHIWTNVPEDNNDLKDEENTAEIEACIAREKSINNAYFGCYFEQIVHRIFRKGGPFRVRSLEPDSNDDLLTETLNKQDEILKFSNVESIENDKYYQPESKTFPSIDAIVAPDKLFQITIATNHPIKVAGLKLLYEKLIKNKEISFYFVVPEKLCGKYQKQNFVTSKDDVSRRLPRWIKNNVKQYVIGIDLSSGGSRNLPNLPRTSSTATIEEGVSNLSTVEEPSASIPAKRSSENQSEGSKGKKRAS